MKRNPPCAEKVKTKTPPEIGKKPARERVKKKKSKGGGRFELKKNNVGGGVGPKKKKRVEGTCEGQKFWERASKKGQCGEGAILPVK